MKGILFFRVRESAQGEKIKKGKEKRRLVFIRCNKTKGKKKEKRRLVLIKYITAKVKKGEKGEKKRRLVFMKYNKTKRKNRGGGRKKD